MMVNSGICRCKCILAAIFRNMVRAKRLCQAFCVMMRTGRLCSGIGAGIAVLHKDVAALKETLQAREKRAEAFAGEGTVVLSPPHFVFGGLLVHDELVGGGAGGVLARVDD